MNTAANVICLKWGTRYPASYVNILYASVRRHLHRPFRFVCITDDPTGLSDGIDVQPFPENPNPDVFSRWPDIFVKLLVFKDGLAGLQGTTLFLDLDVVIQGDIDCFFDYMPGKNCIIHNWIERRKRLFRKRPNIGNSSCFRFEAGQSNYIYETFVREMKDAVNHDLYTTEQAFMTHAMKEVHWWPEEWICSFKRSCIPLFPFNLILPPRQPKAAIVVFHGTPDPDQATVGFNAKKIHRRCLPAKWILDHWHE